MSKKKPPTKPTGPKRPPKGGGYRVLALLALLLFAAPACGADGDGEDIATCAVLGALVAEHLLLNLDCDPELEYLVEFGAACNRDRPDEAEALACLSAVYELGECPQGLPNACVEFGAQ